MIENQEIGGRWMSIGNIENFERYKDRKFGFDWDKFNSEKKENLILRWRYCSENDHANKEAWSTDRHLVYMMKADRQQFDALDVYKKGYWQMEIKMHDKVKELIQKYC